MFCVIISKILNSNALIGALIGPLLALIGALIGVNCVNYLCNFTKNSTKMCVKSLWLLKRPRRGENPGKNSNLPWFSKVRPKLKSQTKIQFYSRHSHNSQNQTTQPIHACPECGARSAPHSRYTRVFCVVWFCDLSACVVQNCIWDFSPIVWLCWTISQMAKVESTSTRGTTHV